MRSAGADIVHGKSFRAGRATDIDDFSQLFLEVDKGTLPVPNQWADNQQALTGFGFQLQGEPGVALKCGFIRQDRMPIGTVALLDHFLVNQVLLRDDLPFLRLVPAKQ